MQLEFTRTIHRFHRACMSFWARGIEFEDRPDYTLLRSIFKKVFYRMGYEYDYIFDWVLEA